ncbi:hypothetical protein JIN85_03230 [Luteolibacter pohnpeiensis]|uniref:Uncharacterized protein n=1 Tax=Luteolibacter pohnpeiensis TaxID=454153 RepID=A0A934S825_9BACT|nr:hypothetical protein [Luteolibacter pohnpeiensis]MBK1881412.1 hypothetical protein [Luteolibacter pohnpeiensis]
MTFRKKIPLIACAGVLILIFLLSRSRNPLEPFQSRESARKNAQNSSLFNSHDTIEDLSSRSKTRLHNDELTDEDWLAINRVKEEFEDYLKEEELHRVYNVASHENPEYFNAFTYEISIKPPTNDEVKAWKLYKKELLAELNEKQIGKAKLALNELDKEYSVYLTNEKKVTVRVPHDESELATYGESFILDLKSGRDSQSAYASSFPSGGVYSLLRFSGHRADILKAWRYDHVLTLK